MQITAQTSRMQNVKTTNAHVKPDTRMKVACAKVLTFPRFKHHSGQNMSPNRLQVKHRCTFSSGQKIYKMSAVQVKLSRSMASSEQEIRTGYL